jgi:hypothetical protein
MTLARGPSEDDEHTLPIWSAVVTAGPRLFLIVGTIVYSLRRYTRLTTLNPESPANRIIDLRVTAEKPFRASIDFSWA